MLQKRIVLHIPHASPVFPFGLSSWDEGINFEVTRWTDWYTDWLFASSGRLDSRIIPVAYPFSRFFCDVERLENDPLEKIGQGIVYTRFESLKRTVSDGEKQFALNSFHEHRQRLVQALSPGTLLVDCHSFPADLSETRIISHFRSKGYSVGVNEPYSNSISPEAVFQYSSLMIEINKQAYLIGDQELYITKACYLRQCIEECFTELLVC